MISDVLTRILLISNNFQLLGNNSLTSNSPSIPLSPPSSCPLLTPFATTERQLLHLGRRPHLLRTAGTSLRVLYENALMRTATASGGNHAICTSRGPGAAMAPQDRDASPQRNGSPCAIYSLLAEN